MKSTVKEYSEYVVNVRKVSKFAVMLKVDGKFIVKLYNADYLTARIDANMEKLIRDHDGVRLREIAISSNLDKVKNLAMRNLATHGETFMELPKRIGDNELEKLVARALGGKWLGRLKGHPCDVILRDGTRIEVKGLGGAWHLEKDKNGKVRDSNWTRENNPAEYHIFQLLENWDLFGDEPEFDD